MTARKAWSEFDLLVALGLYCELPFGKFHQRHPRIIEVAYKLERSPSSVAMKLSNIASLDPIITGSGRKGLAGASQADRDLWQEFSQNLFRTVVLSAYDYQCCVTGIADTRFLVASHIKPWAEDEHNRLNPRNGLCLSTFYDRAFDIGLITFADDYRLMVSSELEKQQSNNHIRETFLERSGSTIELPDKFSPSPEFMRWHRERLFIQ